jgi:hypothetical protein
MATSNIFLTFFAGLSIAFIVQLFVHVIVNLSQLNFSKIILKGTGVLGLDPLLAKPNFCLLTATNPSRQVRSSFFSQLRVKSQQGKAAPII